MLRDLKHTVNPGYINENDCQHIHDMLLSNQVNFISCYVQPSEKQVDQPEEVSNT